MCIITLIVHFIQIIEKKENNEFFNLKKEVMESHKEVLYVLYFMNDTHIICHKYKMAQLHHSRYFSNFCNGEKDK